MSSQLSQEESSGGGERICEDFCLGAKLAAMALCGVGSRAEGLYACGLAESSRFHPSSSQATLTPGSRRSTCRLRSDALGQRLVLKGAQGLSSPGLASQAIGFPATQGPRGIVCLFAFAKKRTDKKKKAAKGTEQAKAEVLEKKPSAKSEPVAAAEASTAAATATATAPNAPTHATEATYAAAPKAVEEEAPAKPKLRVGWHAEQGLREEMEDDIVVQKDAFGGYLYGAVFDGHVGKSTVQFLK